MQYCEEQFLTVAEKYGLCSTEMAAMSLAEVLALHTPVRTHVLCWTKAEDHACSLHSWLRCLRCGAGQLGSIN